MARELLIKNDLLLGSERAREKVGDVYKNIYVPQGAIVVKSKTSDYVYCISKTAKIPHIREGSLTVSVTKSGEDGPALMGFAEAVYIQRLDESAFVIQMAELRVDGDVKEVIRGMGTFYVTEPTFIEVSDETPSEEKE